MTRIGRKTLLTVHVGASVALIGSSAELSVAATHAATRSDAQQAHALYALMQLLVFSLGAPLSFIALATGLWLVAERGWKLLRDGWVTAKLVLLSVTILVGTLATGPCLATLLKATASGVTTDSTRWTLLAAIATQGSMVVASTALAIFKPRRRRAAGPLAPSRALMAPGPDEAYR